MASLRFLCASLLVLTIALASTALSAEPPEKKDSKPKPYRPYDLVVPTSKLIEDYSTQVKKNPKSFVGHLMLAQLYMRRAKENDDHTDYTHAEKSLKEAIKLKSNSPSVRYVQASLLASQHEFVKSLEIAQKLYKENPKMHICLLLIGDAQLELGNIKEAEKAFKQIEEKAPRTYLDSRKAYLASLKGNMDEAIKWMKKAVEGEATLTVTKESRAWYPTRLGGMYFEIGKLKEAETALKDALELHPKYPIALGLMAKVLAAQNKQELAVEMYKKAIAVNEDLPLLAGLGDLFTVMGKQDQAKEYYLRAEKAGQKDLAHAHELSMFYCNTNQHLDKALQIAQEEFKKRPNAHTYDGLAWALYKAHQYDKAAELIEKALATGLKEASLFYHAGMIYLKLNKKDKAELWLTKALELNPHFALIQSQEAKAKLAELKKR